MNIIQAFDDPKLLKPWAKGLDLSAWRVFHQAVDGLEIDGQHKGLFMCCAGRTTFPIGRATEAYAAVGRRGGKSANAALRAVYECAIRTTWQQHLAPGQVAIFPIISIDRQAAQEVFRYVLGILHSTPLLRGMIESEEKEAVTLKNGSMIQVRVASFRSIRGPSYIGVVLDEMAYFRDQETAANPTAEIIGALLPAIVPSGMLLGISSVFNRQGYLWQQYEQNYGREGDVFFWHAPTLTMNPTFDRKKIERERAKDAARAAAEYDSIWRDDVMGLYSPEAVDVAMEDRQDLPYVDGVKYFGFTDPSGGRRDSAALAIAHRDKAGRVIVDAAIERKAPHDPHKVVAEFAELLKAYRLTSVTGDRFGGAWPEQAYKKHGITYTLADMTASELYLAALPMFSGGMIELSKSDRLRNQLCSLMRRTSTGGRDQVIAGQSDSSHADLANAVIGAVVLANREDQHRGFAIASQRFLFGPNAENSGFALRENRVTRSWDVIPAPAREHSIIMMSDLKSKK